MNLLHLDSFLVDGDIYEFFLKDWRLIGCLNGECLPIEGIPGEFRYDIHNSLLPFLKSILRKSSFSLEVFPKSEQKAIRISPFEDAELYEQDYRSSGVSAFG